MNASLKRVLSSFVLVCITALPCALSFESEACAESTTPVADETWQPPALTNEHIAYIAGYPDGTMEPGKAVTRAEAVTFLYRLLVDPENGTGLCSYTDVTDSDWFAEPVRAVCRLGLAANGETFRPNDAITRAEFVAILAKLTDDTTTGGTSFNDVPTDYWAADAIAKAAALGWVGGYEDGTFRPENTLTRAEACAIFNRITTRSGDADQAAKLLTLGLYKDVTATHWAATDIVEASVAHTPGLTFLGEHWDSLDVSGHRFTPGVHEVGGDLYAVDRDGILLTSQSVGAYTAAANGVLSQTSSSYAANVPYISQLDGLNAEMGCEAISALMGLQGKGFATDISPKDFLDNLPYSASNPADGFVGSPYYSDGRYSSIDPQPLADYCNTTCGVNLCEDISGYSVEQVRRELLAGNFIVAYQTFWWKPVSYANFYIDGRLTAKVSNNHVRLICGYDPERGYLVSDPYNYYNRWQTNQYWVAAASFDYCWNQRQMGMVIR